MKRFAIQALALAVLAAAPVHAVSVGVGVFGGASFPVVQDDTGTGAQYGVRVPIGLLPLISVEPYFAHSALGDATETFGGHDYTRSGFDINAFGVNVALGSFGMLPGFPMYPYVGIGTNTLSRDGSDDISEVGYNIGLGIGFTVPPGVSINLRGELNIVATGDTSRKFGNATLGVAYGFMLP